MHSIVTIFRGAVIKVEVANFCAAMDTLIDQDVGYYALFAAVHIHRCGTSCSPNHCHNAGTLIVNLGMIFSIE